VYPYAQLDSNADHPIETAEGLHMAMSLAYYSRNRFILNLLPLLHQANALRRVISVLGATYEGAIFENDFQNRKISFRYSRGHTNSMATLSLEAIAKKAPDVTFINGFPGLVDSGLLRGTKGPSMFVIKVVFRIMIPIMAVPNLECGERLTFLATSAKYPPNAGGNAGVPLVGDGISVAKGTDGEIGSGVYSLTQVGESSGPKIEALLAKFREEGMVEKLWNHTEEEYKRITGVVAV
jgi:hypothetical protein